MSSEQDRRRARRLTPGRLKVILYEQDGELVDISESGACIGLLAQVSGALTAFIVKWEGDILLRGRVVRSWVHDRNPEDTAAAPRVQHRIGVEFVSLPPWSARQLRQRLLAAG